MPVIAPASSPDMDLFERLQACGGVVIGEEAAEHQDIRPARIGLLNLMPAAVMEATELRWLRFISHTILQVEPVLVKFDDDCREHPASSRRPILEHYQPFSAVAEQGLDGLIITGDNQERRADGSPQPLDELYYAQDLRSVIDWASSNVGSSLYSCLASHFALNHRHGLEREIGDRKVFGVFEHSVANGASTTFAMDDTIKAPHSRWGNIDPLALAKAGLNILAENEDIGWLIAEESSTSGHTSTYLQGHPEYWRNDLHDEYIRDQQFVPSNYYPDNAPEQVPVLSWSNDARSLLSNWIQKIYANFSIAGTD